MSNIVESLVVGSLTAVVGLGVAYACSGLDHEALYPSVRNTICEAGEQLPDGPEKDRLREVCKAEASVRECATAFDALAAAAAGN